MNQKQRPILALVRTEADQSPEPTAAKTNPFDSYPAELVGALQEEAGAGQPEQPAPVSIPEGTRAAWLALSDEQRDELWLTTAETLEAEALLDLISALGDRLKPKTRLGVMLAIALSLDGADLQRIFERAINDRTPIRAAWSRATPAEQKDFIDSIAGKFLPQQPSPVVEPSKFHPATLVSPETNFGAAISNLLNALCKAFGEHGTVRSGGFRTIGEYEEWSLHSSGALARILNGGRNIVVEQQAALRRQKFATQGRHMAAVRNRAKEGGSDGQA